MQYVIIYNAKAIGPFATFEEARTRGERIANELFLVIPLEPIQQESVGKVYERITFKNNKSGTVLGLIQFQDGRFCLIPIGSRNRWNDHFFLHTSTPQDVLNLLGSNWTYTVKD